MQKGPWNWRKHIWDKCLALWWKWNSNQEVENVEGKTWNKVKVSGMNKEFCLESWTIQLVCLMFLKAGEQNQGFLRRKSGCRVPSPEPDAAVTNPHVYSPKAVVGWRQTWLRSWTWIAQFSAKFTLQGEADVWDNGVENNTGLRNSVQIGINKTCPTDELHHHVPNDCPLSEKHFCFLAQTVSLSLTSYCRTSLLHFKCHILTQRTESCHPWEGCNAPTKISEEQVPKERLVECWELWQPLCACACACTCMFMVSPGQCFKDNGCPWVHISTVWILNCVDL